MKSLRVVAFVVLLIALLAQPALAADPPERLASSSAVATPQALPIPDPIPPQQPSILASFPVTLTTPWGLGYNDDTDKLVIDEWFANSTVEYSSSGALTGRSWNLSEVSYDFEYDNTRDLMYRVDPLNYSIRSFYPATGAAGPTITDPDGKWGGNIQTAVAYDPASDTLYVGGWYQGAIYHIQGLSWPNPGKPIKTWYFGDVAGMAWLNDGTLAVVTSGATNDIYVVDPVCMKVIDTYDIPGTPGRPGAGIDAEDGGPAWLTNFDDKMVYRVSLKNRVSLSTRVRTPDSGWVVPSGSTYKIRWEAPSNATSFKIYLSKDNGAAWQLIGATQEYATSYDWIVPKPLGNLNSCKVKVEAYGKTGLVGSDTSDGPFTIEVVKLTSPNGGENWKAGTLRTITWDTNKTKGVVAKVKLQYSTNGGTTWTLIDKVWGNPGAYAWILPVSINSTTVKVKVTLIDPNGAVIGVDKSDGNFKIAP